MLEDKEAKGVRRQLIEGGVVDILKAQETIPEYGVIPKLVPKLTRTRKEFEILKFNI